MRRLSSLSTFFYKRVFPFLWFGFLLIFFAIAFWGTQHARVPVDPQQMLPMLAMPLLMGAVGYFIFRKLIADLVDEVWLDGDMLVVKNRGEQRRVSLTDVMNINATTMSNPRRITVMLRTDTRYGRSFSFIPASPRGFMSVFQPDPIAAELIERVDALRGTRR
ncbi:hypothetical protein [Rhodanobacter sp. L36]|uniref:hypothetical protein n=1 Tax=Rhodanobacter sp. L36 TaxID=1747221 RepID=UPI00131EC56C|nr:hypothetical protein [Rhodanobacter sp. L36]